MTEQFPRAEDLPAEPPKSGDPGAWSYVIAALIPIVGWILAAIHLHKHRIGPGLALILTTVISTVVASILVGVLAVAGVVTALDDSPTVTQETPTDPNLDSDGDGTPDDTDVSPLDPTQS